jgi:hypothetical protein
LALWVLLFVVIPPGEQDFPLNDDWAFARGVFTFARGDGFNYSHWASMPQLGQWLWAWPFIQIFGASHAALRFSTVVLSLLGVMAFFDLLRQAGMSLGRAAFVAACFALNPLYFELSGTFLTDVPALAFSLVALALYGRAFTAASANGLRACDLLTVAMVVAVLGAVTRQNTITVPVAAGLVLLRYRRLWYRPAWLVAMAVPAAAAIAAHYWLQARSDYHALPPTEEIDLGRILLLAFTLPHYLGLAAVPVLLLDADWRLWKHPVAFTGFAVALVALGASTGLVACSERGIGALFMEDSPVDRLFPYLDNMLTPYGQFGSNETVVGLRPLVMGFTVRLTLSVVGAIAGAALVVRVVSRLWSGAWKDLLTVFTFAHLPFLFLPSVIFDRYYVVFIPGALYLAARPATKVVAAPAGRLVPGRLLGLATLTFFAWVSVGLMHDWLAWNAARWTVGRRALAKGIEATNIEGGFEWNGWYSPFPVFQNCRQKREGLTLWLTYCMYAHISGRYALSFSVLEGTRVVDQEPYDLWLVSGRRDFYLIEQRSLINKGP